MNPKIISMEEIAQLHFLPNDVLEIEAQRKERDIKLHSAMLLGNREHQKCKIVIHAQEGDSCIETTVWAVTDKYICLKGGLALLIASIIEVIL